MADNLLDLLGIDPSKVSTTTDNQPTQDLAAPADRTGAHVLRLDEWDKEKGGQLAAGHPANVTADEAADFFGMFFQQRPTVNVSEPCHDEARSEFVKATMMSPEYAALHTRTRHNVLESTIAANELCRAWCDSKPEDDTTPADDNQSDCGGQQVPDSVRYLLAGQQAAKEAADGVEMAASVRCLGGWDNSDPRNTEESIEEIEAAFRRVRYSERLRNIMKTAGAFRRCAKAKQRNKTDHGVDEFVGVEPSNDVAKLLPVELGKLADETLELDMLRRLAESQAMCREVHSPVKEGRGPIVVCVDESGSMKNQRFSNAKAFALTMAWIAQHQKRYCLLVGFSRDAGGRVLCLKPGENNQAALLKWLEAKIGGGTSFRCPLNTVPETYWNRYGVPSGRTDMFLLTDGLAPVPPSTIESFNEWKVTQKCRMTTIITEEKSSGALSHVSDEVHFVDDFGIENAAIQEALAV